MMAIVQLRQMKYGIKLYVFICFNLLALIIISTINMEDISLNQSPFTKKYLQNLRTRLGQITQTSNQDYYAISLNFLNNDSYLAQSPLKQINYDLYQNEDPFSGQLKQGLAYEVHYLVISQEILQEIQSQHQCCTILVGRNTKYGDRWLIYKQRLLYCFIDKNRYEEGDQNEPLQCKSIDLFSYNDTQEVRLLILKREGLPQYFCGRFAIYPDHPPKDYAKLKRSLQTKNILIPYFMLINTTEVFKLKRKFKNYLILIQPEGQIVLPDINAECYNHHLKSARYSCICQHKKCFACDQFCFNSNKKHNRCIYTRNKIGEGNQVGEGIDMFQFQLKKKHMGLFNQHNMCFFNTIVQCLTHIKPLSAYFLDNKQQKQLNYWNIDGTYGEVATKYAQFIRNYFNIGNQHCNMPLFQTIGRWHPPYAGKNQQDSHQFLLKILDWLKEDLNRNERKPPYRNIETENKSQEQILRQTRLVLKARNSSIVEQLMQGMQKSVIKCLECNTASTTFDSFLTVQLAMAAEKRIEIDNQYSIVYYVYYMNEQKIKKMRLEYSKNDTISTLKSQTKHFTVRANDYQFDYYRIDNKGRCEKLNNQNMYELLHISDPKTQLIYCTQKYKTNQKGDKIQVKLQFVGEDLFNRPIWLNKEIDTQALYSNVLNYIYRCRIEEIIRVPAQIYFNNKFQHAQFPFDLIIKSKGQETLVHRNKSYKRHSLHEYDTLVVKIRSNPGFDFKRLNICVTNINKDDPPLKKKVTIAQPTIQDCLRMYCKRQRMEQGRWDCSKCQTKRSALKTLYFHQLPQILILSISRFKQQFDSHNQTSYFRKNEKLIKYEEFLNMGSFTQNKGDEYYRLYGVATHIRLNSSLKDVRQMDGHYYAFIRLQGGWMKFDDSSVSVAKEHDVFNNKNAYILFYEKVHKK